MRPRVGLWVALAASWSIGTVLGTTGAALGTEAGRRIVTRHVLALANEALHGSLSVEQVGGSLLDGLEARGVTIRGEDGAVVAAVERLQFRYRLRDLLGGRIVLGQLVLTRPHVNLVQPRPGAPFNLEEILGIGAAADKTGAPGNGGPGPLLAFRDVQISDGTVIIRTPTDAADGAIVEREPGPDSYLRVRRVEQLSARFDYVRLSSPLRGEEAVLIEVRRFSARVTDPAIVATELRGRVQVWDDSLTMDLPAFQLGETAARVTGSLAWGTDTLLVNLHAQADKVVTDEVRGLVADVPAGLAGTGDFTIRSISGDVLEWYGERLDLHGRPEGGRVRGQLGMVLGPGDSWEFRSTELDLRNFDLEYVRGFLDTLPVAGRVTGRVSASGLREYLRVDLDVTFRDSLVAEWPESSFRGTGAVSLGVPGDLVFQRFQLEDANVSLASVHRLIPAVKLVGHVQGVGVLDGPWLEVSFDGELRYADPPLPETIARGAVRLDARGDTLGVWADLELDSLQLAGFHSSYTGMDLDAVLAGSLGLAGYLDSLAIASDLGGPAGEVSARGALFFVPGRSGAHGIELRVRRLDLAGLRVGLPSTSLNAQVVLQGSAGSDAAPAWHAALAMDGSVVQGVSLDSAVAVLQLADSVLTVDTLWVRGSQLEANGGGEFGLSASRAGTLALTGVSDSVGVVEPLLARWLGSTDTSVAGVRPSGSLAFAAQMQGSVDAYRLSGTVDADRLRRGGLFVSSAQGRATWVAPTGELSFDAAVDSVQLGEFAFGGIEARLRGRADSMAWHGRSRFGADGIWIGGGRVTTDSVAYRVTIDSLGALLATSSWFVDPSTVIVARDSGIDFSDVVAASDRTAGRVTVRGRLPFAGPGYLTVSIEALPIQDLWMLLQREYGETAGELSGTLQLAGTARAPRLDLSVALRNGVFGAFRAPYVEGVVGYRDQRLVGDVRLWREGERILEIDLEFPVDLALAEVEQRRLPGPLRVRAEADSVDLALLEAITPLTRDASGTLDADVGIMGTWERPQLTGRLAVRDGAATFPALGVRHRDIDGSVVLSGDTIRIEHWSVNSGAGSAEVSGLVRLMELSRPILNLHVTANEFRAIDVRDFLSLTATADLDLSGPLYQATLTGRGTATRGVLYFADLLTKDIVNLEDTLFAEIVDVERIRREGLGAAFESRFLDSLRIDSLRLEMGSDVWMRSGEANIQLSGVVNVDKLQDRYRLTGSLETPRGTYRLELPPAITREFTVSRGQVQYFGTPDLNADLDIEARHVLVATSGENVTVFVHIGGTLYAPSLTFTSDIRPPISETEVIAYLLFGAPSVQAFAGSAGAPNRAVTQLLGALSGEFEYSLIADLGVPLDYLQIRPASTVAGGLSGAEIAVGKQFRILGTTAFLTASPRICPQELVKNLTNPGASLEFRLSRQWLLSASVDPLRSCETAAGTTYQVGLDLFWEKSY